MSMPTRALVALFILVGALGLTACESKEPPAVEVPRVVTQVVELTPAPPTPGAPRALSLIHISLTLRRTVSPRTGSP